MRKYLLLAMLALATHAHAVNQIWTMRNVATGTFLALTQSVTVVNLTQTTGVSCAYPSATNCAPLVIYFTPLAVSSAAHNLSFCFGYLSAVANSLTMSSMVAISTTAVYPSNGDGCDPNLYWYLRSADTGPIPVNYDIYSVSNY